MDLINRCIWLSMDDSKLARALLRSSSALREVLDGTPRHNREVGRQQPIIEDSVALYDISENRREFQNNT